MPRLIAPLFAFVLFNTCVNSSHPSLQRKQRDDEPLRIHTIKGLNETVNLSLENFTSLQTIRLGSGASESSFLLTRDGNGQDDQTTRVQQPGRRQTITIETADESSPIAVTIYSYSIPANASLVIAGLDEPKSRANLAYVHGSNRVCTGRTRPPFPLDCRTPHYSSLNLGHKLQINLDDPTDDGGPGKRDSIQFAFLFTAFTPSTRAGDCPANTYNCGNGLCVRKSLQDDGYNNCGNYRDEFRENLDWTGGAMAAMVTFIVVFNLLLALIVWATCIRNAGRLVNGLKANSKLPQINVAFQGD